MNILNYANAVFKYWFRFSNANYNRLVECGRLHEHFCNLKTKLSWFQCFFSYPLVCFILLNNYDYLIFHIFLDFFSQAISFGFYLSLFFKKTSSTFTSRYLLLESILNGVYWWPTYPRIMVKKLPCRFYLFAI